MRFLLKILTFFAKSYLQTKQARIDERERRLFNSRQRKLYLNLAENSDLYANVVSEISRRSKSKRNRSLFSKNHELWHKKLSVSLESERADRLFYFLKYYKIIDIEALKTEYSTKDLFKRIRAAVKKVTIFFSRILNVNEASFSLWPFPSGTAYPPQILS